MATPFVMAQDRIKPAHHQPVAIVFNFVAPERAGRWPRRLRRQARCDEAGGTPPLQDHGRRISPRRRAISGWRLQSQSQHHGYAEEDKRIMAAVAGHVLDIVRDEQRGRRVDETIANRHLAARRIGSSKR